MGWRKCRKVSVFGVEKRVKLSITRPELWHMFWVISICSRLVLVPSAITFKTIMIHWWLVLCAGERGRGEKKRERGERLILVVNGFHLFNTPIIRFPVSFFVWLNLFNNTLTLVASFV